jgi:RNA polymerase sigma factor (TIGR02999 family)
VQPVYHVIVPPPRDITEMLADLTGGNREAVNALLPLVYDELRAVADNQLRLERKDHTLNATALVHEAYFKLVDQSRVTWQNRAHFLGVAARAMRRILVNYAVARRAQKRGGELIATTYDDELVPRASAADEVVALDEALERLQQLNERQAAVVEYRFFGGLTQEEIAEVLGVSVPTVKRDWRMARAWLSHELSRK